MAIRLGSDLSGIRLSSSSWQTHFLSCSEDSNRRLEVAKSRATVSSAVASVRTSGVKPTCKLKQATILKGVGSISFKLSNQIVGIGSLIGCVYGLAHLIFLKASRATI